MCLTCVDMELFFNHYDVYEINYIGGYMFRSAKGIFAPYVKHWTEQKTLAKINHNDGMYTLSKLMQNAVYGRMALNPRVASKKPFLNEDGILCYKQLESEYRDPLYIPAGSFITAWARYTTITAAQYNYGRWVYSDTDSVHLLGTSNPINMLLDSTKLGAWDHEFTFERAIYLRQKTYLLYGYEPDNPDKMKHKLACAGMPRCVRQKRDIQRQNDDGSYNIVDFDNFKFGSVFYGALKPKRVKGGIVLENIPWMLKD